MKKSTSIILSKYRYTYTPLCSSLAFFSAYKSIHIYIYINYLTNKSLFIDPHFFIFIIIHHFIMFETITYNNLKILVHYLVTRLYDQYHHIWTWRVKIYYKNIKVNTINSWKTWGQRNVKVNINTTTIHV